MTDADTRAWLDAHVNLESLGLPPGHQRRLAHPTLERMRALAALLGSPQHDLRAVHLTGTNGKTTVARLVSALLVGAGLSCGTYTSPHLERVNERISWNAVPIDDESLDEQLARIMLVEPHLPDIPSFFEILTGAAFSWFADIAVEAAVVEVGLGGTWDATNVVDAPVAVVTNVSLDHTEYLGPTRTSIAGDKSGIIKKGATLVLGETDPELRPLFLAREPGRVALRGVDFGLARNVVAHGGRVVDLWTPHARYDDVFLSLHGAHQADNAAVALMAAEAFLDSPLPESLVLDVFGSATSPGRLEVIGHDPLVLLDGAHNVAGAHSLRAALAEEFAAAPRIFVVGLLRQKEPHEMLEAMGAPSASRLVCCRAPSPRALDPSQIAGAARDLGVEPGAIEVIDDVADAVRSAVAEASPNAQVIVTGTLYVVGAARSALRHDAHTESKVPPS